MSLNLSYNYRSLTTSINALQTPPSLILDKVFKLKNQNFGTTLDVDIEKSAEYKKLAPFVASSQEGKVVSKVGYTSKTVKFPRIRVKKQLSAAEILAQKELGESIYVGENATVENGSLGKIAREQNHLKAIITKRIEWMAAQALTGTITYSSDDVNFSVDYGFATSHKPNLSGNYVWGGSSADIIGNIRAWKKLITQDTGLTGDLAIVGSAALDKMLADSNVKALLGNQGMAVGQLQVDSTNYVGRLCGVDIYECTEQYFDGSSNQNMIADNAFILVAQQGKFIQEYGLIEDLEAEARVGMEFFSKLWFEKDPSAAWLLAESNPLPVVYQPDAVVYATV